MNKEDHVVKKNKREPWQCGECGRALSYRGHTVEHCPNEQCVNHVASIEISGRDFAMMLAKEEYDELGPSPEELRRRSESARQAQKLERERETCIRCGDRCQRDAGRCEPCRSIDPEKQEKPSPPNVRISIDGRACGEAIHHLVSEYIGKDTTINQSKLYPCWWCGNRTITQSGMGRAALCKTCLESMYASPAWNHNRGLPVCLRCAAAYKIGCFMCPTCWGKACEERSVEGFIPRILAPYYGGMRDLLKGSHDAVKIADRIVELSKARSGSPSPQGAFGKLPCIGCGTPLDEPKSMCDPCMAFVQSPGMVICGSCGAEKSPGQLFCDPCFHRLQTDRQATRFEPPLRRGTVVHRRWNPTIQGQEFVTETKIERSTR